MKHFIYQDEKSHKFWAVEQQGNELHICWGKVGDQRAKPGKKFCGCCGSGKSGA